MRARPSLIACAGLALLLSTVAHAATRYVWASSPSPGAGYLAWSNAAHTIQEAVDAAAPGDTVRVTNGTYATGGRVVLGSLTNRLAVTNAIRVESVNGPSSTTIAGQGDPVSLQNGDGAVRGVWLSGGAELVGFTVSNGHTRATGDLYADQSGGGIWCAGALASNCVVIGNTAYYQGGGVYSGTLHACTILYNFASGGGGASETALYGCTVTNNHSSGGAGGVIGCTLEGCRVVDNSVIGDGGGGGAYGCIMSNCLVEYNATQGMGAGGGMYFGILYNCVLRYNYVSHGSGGGASMAMLHNCTVVSNVADFGGGVDGSTLDNCILRSNTGRDSAPDYDPPSILDHSCAVPLAQGVGNITNDPGFVNPAAGDYRLAPGSPCTNAGTNDAWMADGRDLDGRPRIIGGCVDMGAYESTNGVTTNGVAWGWLLDYGLATDGSADRLDPDGDRFPTLQEYMAGTDPTNAGSFLGIVSVSNAPAGKTGTVVRWTSATGRRYRLACGSNLLGAAPFPLVVHSNIPAIPPLNTATDATAVGRGPYYYRIVLEP